MQKTTKQVKEMTVLQKPDGQDQVPLPTDNSHIRDLSSSMIPDSSLAYDTSVYLEDAVFSAYDADTVKLLISEYGSVSTMIYMDNSGK